MRFHSLASALALLAVAPVSDLEVPPNSWTPQ
jgi:hypothetical protein